MKDEVRKFTCSSSGASRLLALLAMFDDDEDCVSGCGAS